MTLKKVYIYRIYIAPVQTYVRSKGLYKY